MANGQHETLYPTALQAARAFSEEALRLHGELGDEVNLLEESVRVTRDRQHQIGRLYGSLVGIVKQLESVTTAAAEDAQAENGSDDGPEYNPYEPAFYADQADAETVVDTPPGWGGRLVKRSAPEAFLRFPDGSLFDLDPEAEVDVSIETETELIIKVQGDLTPAALDRIGEAVARETRAAYVGRAD